MLENSRIANLIGRALNRGEDQPETATLAELFREREATLNLTAEFSDPIGNMNDQPTAVFPYTLFDSEGAEYGTGAKEFVIPDNGFNDDDAAVTQFVAGVTDTAPVDVGVGALQAVAGTTADAEFDEQGDVIVNVPEVPTEAAPIESETADAENED